MNKNIAQSSVISTINTEFDVKPFTATDIADALPQNNRKSVMCTVLLLKKAGLIEVIGQRKGRGKGNRLVELFRSSGFIMPNIIISHDGRVTLPGCNRWDDSGLSEFFGLVARPVDKDAGFKHRLEG